MIILHEVLFIGDVGERAEDADRLFDEIHNNIMLKQEIAQQIQETLGDYGFNVVVEPMH